MLEFYTSPRPREMFSKMENRPALQREQDDFGNVNRRVSELVAQGELHLSGAVNSSKDRSECAVARPRVRPAENMAVERVDEFRLQCDGLRFEETHSLDNRKVLIEISLTAELTGYARHVSERIPTLCNQIGSIRIDKRCAVEIGGACSCRESSIKALFATACARVGCACLIKRRSPRTEQWLTGNSIQSNTPREKRGVSWDSRGAAKTQRLTTLVALNATNLPSADHLVSDAAFVQEFLALP